MSRQIRTWHEQETGEDSPRRWNVAINGKPVPGGYIEQITESAFEIHYPHLEPKTFDTLEEAKRRIELAPPVSRGDMAVACPAPEEATDLLTADEAGELLGVSRFRINAMVANGALAGRRSGGRTLVSRASVEAKRARKDDQGPIGRFAHVFICYRPASLDTPWRLAEIDPEDTGSMDEAKTFLQAVVDNELPGTADVLDYRQAMALRAKARRALGEMPRFAEAVTLSDLVSLAGDDRAAACEGKPAPRTA